MNSHIEKTLELVSKLDSWDVGSVLGGVNHLVRQAAINMTVRMLPDLPEEGSGLEHFAQWEKNVRKPEIAEKVAPLLGLADRVAQVMVEYSTMDISDNAKVLEMSTSPDRVPKRATFEREYKERVRLGMKPGMSIREFTEMEHATALQRHAVLCAKGEHAVQIMEGIDISDGDLPEWMHEAVNSKVLQKLEERWRKAELRRTNPRISKNERDLAGANQKLIEATITELGGTVPTDTEETAPEVLSDLDKFIAMAEGFGAKVEFGKEPPKSK
jgi:hypothetical protein